MRIHPEHYRWLVLLGALAAIGSYLLATAFRSAPASVVAPLEYTALLWGILIDRVVWNVLPSARVCWGGAVVIGSGLYLIWRERTPRGARGGRAVMAAATLAGQNSAPVG